MSKSSITITLELQYQQAMMYLNGLYHTYESSLPEIPLSPLELAAAESMAVDIVSHAQIEAGVPIGKLVI